MRLFRILILSLIIVAFGALFFLECCIRLMRLAPALPVHYAEFVKDGCLPFKAKPNSVTSIKPWPEGNEFEFVCVTNSQGFRDTEHDFKKPGNTFRILTLGDSFTFGAGAPFQGTYPFQLEKLLNESAKKIMNVEIINAGQSRYWPEPERLLLETVGVKYKPDLILAQFSPNDVTDTCLGMNFNMVKDGYLVSREGYELGGVGVWLYVNSHLCRNLIRLYLDHKLKHLTFDQKREIKGSELYKSNGYHEKDWVSLELEYKQMVRIANKIGARFMLVYLPLRPGEDEYPLKRLTEWGKRNGVPVIDTRSPINNASLREKVYWSQDIHCTEAGYRVIAETIASYLIDKQLIPERPKG